MRAFLRFPVKSSGSVGREGPFLDWSRDSLKVVYRGSGCEIPLERAESGLLTDPCRERVRDELRRFLGSRGGSGRRALCALPARGVSLRRFSVPRGPEAETLGALTLQVERDFPLPPDRLAWGYVADGVDREEGGSDIGSRRFTVAAMRRELLDEYGAVLRDAGLVPVFEVGGFGSHRLCDPVPEPHGLLDIGKTHSEFLLFEGREPRSVRVLPWGGEDVTRAVAGFLGVDADAAEVRKRDWAGSIEPGAPDAGSPEDRGTGRAIEDSVEQLVGLLVRELSALRSPGQGSEAAGEFRIYLAGGGSRLRGLAARLEHSLRRELGRPVSCRLLEVPDAPGISAVTLGLAREDAEPGSASRLTLLPGGSPGEGNGAGAATSKKAVWFAAAAVLAIAALALRYAVPLIEIPVLREELEEKRAVLESLPDRSRELGFLRYVRNAREGVAFLDLLTAISRAAPPGLFLTEVSIGGSGDVFLQGSVADQQAANEFRRGLLVCGLYANVVLQLSPPGKESVAFRLQATAVKGANLDDFRPAETAPTAASDAGGGGGDTETATTENGKHGKDGKPDPEGAGSPVAADTP